MLNQILSRKRRNSFVKGTGTFKGYLWGCGGNLPHTGACPAKGKICHYCYKPNHFISMCRKLKKKENVHGVSKGGDNAASVSTQYDSSTEDEYCYSINPPDFAVGTIGTEDEASLYHVSSVSIITTRNN